MNTKVCVQCKTVKPFSDFHKRTKSHDGLQPRCKPCNNQRVREWQKSNPDQARELWERRYGSLKRRATKYGISESDLAALLDKADGKCEICQQKPNKWLVVDHCHTKGNIRGILCERCNTALGLFKDNTSALRRAISYLNK